MAIDLKTPPELDEMEAGDVQDDTLLVAWDEAKGRLKRVRRDAIAAGGGEPAGNYVVNDAVGGESGTPFDARVFLVNDPEMDFPALLTEASGPIPGEEPEDPTIDMVLRTGGTPFGYQSSLIGSLGETEVIHIETGYTALPEGGENLRVNFTTKLRPEAGQPVFESALTITKIPEDMVVEGSNDDWVGITPKRLKAAFDAWERPGAVYIPSGGSILINDINHGRPHIYTADYDADFSTGDLTEGFECRIMKLDPTAKIKFVGANISAAHNTLHDNDVAHVVVRGGTTYIFGTDSDS